MSQNRIVGESCHFPFILYHICCDERIFVFDESFFISVIYITT